MPGRAGLTIRLAERVTAHAGLPRSFHTPSPEPADNERGRQPHGGPCPDQKGRHSGERHAASSLHKPDRAQVAEACRYDPLGQAQAGGQIGRAPRRERVYGAA